MECLACGGTGKIGEDDCKCCGGTGIDPETLYNFPEFVKTFFPDLTKEELEEIYLGIA